MKIRNILPLAFVLASFAPERLGADLVALNGSPVPGVVVAANSKEVLLETGGRQTPVKLAQLSPESQAEAISAAKANRKWNPYPPIAIQAQVPTKRRPQSGSFYMKTMSIEPKVVISGNGSLVPIPAAEAIFLVIVMDTRAKYTDGKEQYIVKTSETIPVPAAPDGKRRQFDFKPSEVSYDGYRDATNVGGFVYKYFIFALREPESGSIVNFQTNNPPLEKFIGTDFEKLTPFLSLKENSSFPADFKPAKGTDPAQ